VSELGRGRRIKKELRRERKRRRGKGKKKIKEKQSIRENQRKRCGSRGQSMNEWSSQGR
jgi:hypothetical protein